MRDGELGDEARDGEGVRADDEVPARADAVGPEGGGEDDDHGEEIDGDGQELRVGGAVAELFDDGGDGGGEAGGRGRRN